MPLRSPLELFDRKSGARCLTSAPNPKQRASVLGPIASVWAMTADFCSPHEQTSSPPAISDGLKNVSPQWQLFRSPVVPDEDASSQLGDCRSKEAAGLQSTLVGIVLAVGLVRALLKHAFQGIFPPVGCQEARSASRTPERVHSTSTR